MSKEMITALDALEQEKGIKKDVVIDALEAALVSAYKRNYGQAQNVAVEFDNKKGDIHVYAVKKVVEEVMDPQQEVSLSEALGINKAYELDDEIKFEVTPKNFGRIAAQTAKQVIMQRVREAERGVVYEKYSQYEDEIVTGEVARRDNRYVYVDLGGVEAVMSRQDQIPDEQYEPHDHIKVYVTKVDDSGKGPQVYVSRSASGLLKRLFEQEVPEIYDGTVELFQLHAKLVIVLRLLLSLTTLISILSVLVSVLVDNVFKQSLMNFMAKIWISLNGLKILLSTLLMH